MSKTLIHDTTSLCDQCYKHIPGKLYLEHGSVYIEKHCEEHGNFKHLVEPNGVFYTSYEYPERDIQHFFDAVCLDITNKCNLSCPHCYQMPDNSVPDASISSILETIEKWKYKNKAIVLMGAEPTVRKDLIDLIRAINSIVKTKIMILTNGVNLHKEEYVKQFTEFQNVSFTFGLNHPSYQGIIVRQKQEQGLENCLKYNIPIKNISYTLESFDQLDYCLNEIQHFNNEKKYCSMYRIRVGTDIGRSPDVEKMYMSHLVEKTKQVCLKNDWTFTPRPDLGIRAHYPVEINGVLVKLIQWPDVHTIDLKEVQTESWADMLPGKPVSPLVHQVLLRDRLVNNNLPLLDTVEETYRMEK